MAQASITPEPVTLEVKRTFAAPRERVFRAWTNAEELAQWFAPSAEYTVIVPELDLRVGGRYRIEMHHKGGNVSCVTGIYRAVQPPERLSFTWQWTQREFAETLVHVEFRAVGNETEVQVTHELLPTAEERENHGKGWNGCFGRLAEYL